MTPETLEALKASIAKWERNARVRDVDGAKIFASSCPLCVLFDLDGTNDCKGCPVRMKTGQPSCRGTPWGKTLSAQRKGDRKAFVAAARDEVAFLKSLLPQGEGDAS